MVYGGLRVGRSAESSGGRPKLRKLTGRTESSKDRREKSVSGCRDVSRVGLSRATNRVPARGRGPCLRGSGGVSASRSGCLARAGARVCLHEHPGARPSPRDRKSSSPLRISVKKKTLAALSSALGPLE